MVAEEEGGNTYQDGYKLYPGSGTLEKKIFPSGIRYSTICQQTLRHHSTWLTTRLYFSDSVFFCFQFVQNHLYTNYTLSLLKWVKLRSIRDEKIWQSLSLIYFYPNSITTSRWRCKNCVFTILLIIQFPAFENKIWLYLWLVSPIYPNFCCW